MSEPNPAFIEPKPIPAPKPGPQPNPQPQQEPNPPADQKPPWGDDFDAEKAWNLIKNLRGDKDKLKSDLEQQATADREELEKLRNERLSADERALKEAKEQAANEARSEADAQWRSRYLTSELKGIAASVIKDGDQLKSFMAITDPSKFVGENGEIDEEKVMGHLTALYVGSQQQRAPRQWGQYSAPGEPIEKPGATARAALEKRHGVKNSS